MLSANRLSFSELFDDISLVLNVRILCMVVDSRIGARMVLTGRTQVFGCWTWLSCYTKIFCASHKNVSSVFSLADFALKSQFSTQDSWIYNRSSLSGLLALNHLSCGFCREEGGDNVYYVSISLLSIPCDILSVIGTRKK